MPRIPLLGSHLPNKDKQKKAFTIKSEQRIHDIGKPDSVRFEKPLKTSKFRESLLRKDIPLMFDHSGSLNTLQTIWKIDYSKIDFIDIMPRLIEGLSDKDYYMRRIAAGGLKDLLKHAQPTDLLMSIPYMVLEIKNVLRTGNYFAIRDILNFFYDFIPLIDGTVAALEPYIVQILFLLNRFIETAPDLGANIYYAQVENPMLADLIDKLITMLEQYSGRRRYNVVRLIKSAIPSYHSQLLD